jgi:hypothetical protein
MDPSASSHISLRSNEIYLVSLNNEYMYTPSHLVFRKFVLGSFRCFQAFEEQIQSPNTSETLDAQKLEKVIFMNFEEMNCKKLASYKKEWWNTK